MLRVLLLRGVIAFGITTALSAVPAVVTSGPITVLAGCGTGYYTNSNGQCIPDPLSGLPPGGAPGLLGGGPPRALPPSAEMATTHSAPITAAPARDTVACGNGWQTDR